MRDGRTNMSLLLRAAVLLALAAALAAAGAAGQARAADPVLAGAGDISCDPLNSNYRGGLGSSAACRQKYTSDLLVAMNPAAVINLGDNQYECGSLAAFQQSYDPTWGRVKAITHPSIGNHEYITSSP